MPSPNPSQQPKIIDSPDAGEIYANTIANVSYDNGSVIIVLGVLRFSPTKVGAGPEMPSVHIVKRIVLSPPAVTELVNSVQSLLGSIARLAQSTPPPGGRAN